MVKVSWKSKTVWAIVASAAIAIGAFVLGETNIYVTSAITLASAFGIYGRFVSTEKLKVI